MVLIIETCSISSWESYHNPTNSGLPSERRQAFEVGYGSGETWLQSLTRKFQDDCDCTYPGDERRHHSKVRTVYKPEEHLTRNSTLNLPEKVFKISFYGLGGLREQKNQTRNYRVTFLYPKPFMPKPVCLTVPNFFQDFKTK